MKTLKTLFLTLFTSTIALAQPSDAATTSDLKKSFPNLTKVTFGGSGSTKKEFENNTWVTYFRRDVAITTPSSNKSYPNTKVMWYGGVSYTVSGGAYVFKKYNPASEEVIGMPDPNKDEALSLINQNLDKAFPLALRNEIIGTPGQFEWDNSVKFSWPTYNHVYFKIWSTYELFTSNVGDAQKIKQAFEVRLYREEGMPWNNIVISRGVGEGDKIVVATKKYTDKERETLQTYQMIIGKELAAKKWASLIPITIPNFKDKFDAMEFVHATFMEGNVNKTESLLYNMLAQSYYFDRINKEVLSRDGEELVPSIMSKVVLGEYLYQNQYCPMPEIKEHDQTSVDIWNKNKTAYARYTFGLEANTWKIMGITMHLVTDTEKAKIVAASPCTKTSLSAIERGEREGVSKLKPNDLVLAYYESDGYWYPSFYQSYSNYYYQVQYLIDNSKGTVRKAIPYTPTIGDKAYVKTQSGAMVEVTVLSVNKYDIEIDFNGTKTAYKISGLLFKK